MCLSVSVDRTDTNTVHTILLSDLPRLLPQDHQAVRRAAGVRC